MSHTAASQQGRLASLGPSFTLGSLVVQKNSCFVHKNLKAGISFLQKTVTSFTIIAAVSFLGSSQFRSLQRNTGESEHMRSNIILKALSDTLWLFALYFADKL